MKSHRWSFQAYLYGPQRGPLELSLEQAAQRLSAHPDIHFEWDGSFIAAGPEGYQVSGTLFDNGSVIQYVELHGRAEGQSGRVGLHGKIDEVLHLLVGHSEHGAGTRVGETSEIDAGVGQSWGALESRLSIMRLPGPFLASQKWQSLQSFEEEITGLDFPAAANGVSRS